MNHNYDPLPQEIELRPSSIHGYGLFAKSRISALKVLGRTHYKIAAEVLRMPLGGFINHSNEPNCFLEQRGRALYLVSNEQIIEGAELTVTYGAVKELEKQIN